MTTPSQPLQRMTLGQLESGQHAQGSDLEGMNRTIAVGRSKKAGLADFRDDLRAAKEAEIDAPIGKVLGEFMAGIRARAEQARAQRLLLSHKAALRDAATALDPAKGQYTIARVRGASLHALRGLAEAAVADRDLGVAGLIAEELQTHQTTEPGALTAITETTAMLHSIPMPARDRALAAIEGTEKAALEATLVLGAWTGKSRPVDRLAAAHAGLKHRIPA